MNLNDLAKQCNDYARRKGFRDEPRAVGIDLMLMVSELSEALEADRTNKRANFKAYSNAVRELEKENSFGNTEFIGLFQTYIKDTYEDEIADALIRILEHCGQLGINIQRHYDLKVKYNELRPHKHGKNY